MKTKHGSNAFPKHSRDSKPIVKGEGIPKEGEKHSGSKIGMSNLRGTLYNGHTKPGCK